MSVAEIQGRVVQLQALIDQAVGRVAAPPAPVAAVAAATGSSGPGTTPTTFAAALDTATAAQGPTGVPSGGDDGGPLAGMIQAAAARHGLDPQVFTNLVRQESGFDPQAGSPAGARGLCQLMPGTARALGVQDLTDPAQSLEGGARYLRQQLDRFGGDYRKALAAYNAGPGAVERFGGVPPYGETQHYVATILGSGRA